MQKPGLIGKLLLIVIILITSINVYPLQLPNKTNTHKPLIFRPITVDEGLSDNLIQSITEDQTGYIWVGTRFGLNKLNGIDVKNYYHHPADPRSIPSNIIYSVFCDTSGKTWIGTDNGLCYYSEEQDIFTPAFKEKIQLDKKIIYDINEDAKHQLWFATEIGLLKYNPHTDSLEVYNHKNTGFPNAPVYRIFIDNDQLWLSFLNEGLCIFDLSTKKATSFKNNPGNPKSLSGKRVEHIMKDTNGDIWLATYNHGINKFNSADSSFTRFDIDPDNTYTSRVKTIFEDPSGILHFGTRNGIYFFDRGSNKFIFCSNSESEFSKLSANSVLCSFIDHSKGLWIGTYYGGLNYTNLESKPFISYTSKKDNPQFLNNSTIFGMDEDKEGNLYIGTEKGVNILNHDHSKFTYLTHDPKNPNSLSYNDVKSVAALSNGDLWIATNNGGLNYYSKKLGKFKVFRHDPADSTSLPNDKVYFIKLDSHENLWVITNNYLFTQNSRLSLLKKGSTSFVSFKGDFYNSIIEDSQHNILAGGINGFWKYQTDKDDFKLFMNDSIVGKHVWCLHEDKNGNIWVGSENGLAKFDSATEGFTKFPLSNSIAAKIVYGILEDDLENLWVSTNSGLYKLMDTSSPVDSVVIREYDKNDGLPSKEFIYNSFFKNKNGEMFFGGNNGLVQFHPDQIKDDRFRPKVAFSELHVNSKTISPGEKIGNRVVLKKTLEKTSQLIFSHKVKSFTLKFDALHFANPKNNRFSYKLENFNDNWQHANSYNNYVTYYNLPAGNYTFKIYAINEDGVSSLKAKEININILPPFWETWLFRILSVFFVLIVLYFHYKQRVNQFKLQEKILRDAVEERTTKLNQSNKELIEQREIIEQKNQLLENANKNLQYLNDFGLELTSKLKLTEIQDIIQKSLSPFIQVDVIGLGLFDEAANEIVFSNFSEAGKLIPEFTSKLDDPTSLAAYCIKNNKMVISNDYKNEYKSYIEGVKLQSSQHPLSVFFLPLSISNKIIGVLTLQSYKKNAFNKENIEILNSLLSYITIAFENASTYEIMKKQKDEIEKHHHHLEQVVAERTKNLEIAKNKAEENDKLKSAFLANMSHEIRTPLNAIIGFADLVDNPGLSPEKKQTYYSIIKKSGYTLLQLINDIIDFSRIEAGQLEIFYESVNINEFLTDIFNSNSQEFGKDTKGLVELKLSNPLKGQLIINTAPVRLQQIFNNLISNAFKFTHQGILNLASNKSSLQRRLYFL